MATILSVDPGTSVGFCVVQTDEPTKLVSQGQLTPTAFVDWMRPVLLGAVNEVVCEKFIIGQRTLKSQGQGVQDALDVEGWLRLECFSRRVPFTTQRNGDTLAFSTDEKLKSLGWWDLGRTRSNRDVRSACRHMLKYLVDHRYLNPLTVPGFFG
jgi:hypothetical protein